MVSLADLGKVDGATLALATRAFGKEYVAFTLYLGMDLELKHPWEIHIRHLRRLPVDGFDVAQPTLTKAEVLSALLLELESGKKLLAGTALPSKRYLASLLCDVKQYAEDHFTTAARSSGGGLTAEAIGEVISRSSVAGGKGASFRRRAPDLPAGEASLIMGGAYEPKGRMRKPEFLNRQVGERTVSEAAHYLALRDATGSRLPEIPLHSECPFGDTVSLARGAAIMNAAAPVTEEVLGSFIAWLSAFEAVALKVPLPSSYEATSAGEAFLSAGLGYSRLRVQLHREAYEVSPSQLVGLLTKLQDKMAVWSKAASWEHTLYSQAMSFVSQFSFVPPEAPVAALAPAPAPASTTSGSTAVPAAGGAATASDVAQLRSDMDKLAKRAKHAELERDQVAPPLPSPIPLRIPDRS